MLGLDSACTEYLKCSLREKFSISSVLLYFPGFLSPDTFRSEILLVPDYPLHFGIMILADLCYDAGISYKYLKTKFTLF